MSNASGANGATSRTPSLDELPPDAEIGKSVDRANTLWERVAFVLFWAIHVACFAAIWTGVSVKSVVIAISLYWLRMFAVTAGYHRYFAHRTFKTSRLFQFLLHCH